MITREFPPEPGGISYYVYNLSKKLTEKGHKVTVITRGSIANSLMEETIDNVRVIHAPFFPVYPLHLWIHGIFVNRLVKLLESEFDIVHLHSPIVPVIKTSLPKITTVHTPMKIDAEHHEIIDFYSLAERLQCSVFYPPEESKLFKASKSLTAVSFSVANELKTYGLDPKKITVLGNGVDERTFTPLYSRKSNEQYVLFTGVLRARKGLSDLLECAEYVCALYPGVRFIICGTGPFYGNLDREVQRRRMNENFILLGHVKRDRLIWLYQNATVHCVPSHYEGLPTVLLEAMSCGIPVVATDVGGNKEAITTGVNGFLVPPKAPKVMGKTILRLLKDAELRTRVGKAARRTIEEHYTWDKIADKTLLCYEKVL